MSQCLALGQMFLCIHKITTRSDNTFDISLPRLMHSSDVLFQLACAIFETSSI